MRHAIPTAALLALIGGCTIIPPAKEPVAQAPARPGPQATATARPVPSQSGLAWARFGDEVYVDGPRVTPQRLIEDSRCPADVACVWAGQVRIEARIELSSGTVVRELTSGKPEPVADGTLELVEIRPPRASQVPIPLADYRFGLRFAGGL